VLLPFRWSFPSQFSFSLLCRGVAPAFICSLAVLLSSLSADFSSSFVELFLFLMLVLSVMDGIAAFPALCVGLYSVYF